MEIKASISFSIFKGSRQMPTRVTGVLLQTGRAAFPPGTPCNTACKRSSPTPECTSGTSRDLSEESSVSRNLHMNMQQLVIKPQSQYFKRKEKLCCLSDIMWSEEEGMPRHTLDITQKQLQELGRGIRRL